MTKINPMEAVTNRDFAVASVLKPAESVLFLIGAMGHKFDQHASHGQKIASNRHSDPDVHVTLFEDGHEITIPKRMEPEEAARYAALQGLF